MKALTNKLNKKAIALTVAATMAASSVAVYAYDRGHDGKRGGDEAVTQAIAATAQVSMQQAMNIAKQNNAGTIMSVELEQDDGKLIYEVESISREKNAEYELEIDASTGEIIESETDKLRKHDIAESDAYSKAGVKLAQAMSIATSAQAGNVISAEFDVDDGKALYEVEVAATDGNTYEIEIDPATGSVLSKTIDNDDCGGRKGHR